MENKIIDKIIERLLGENQNIEVKEQKGNDHPYIGKYIIVRGYRAGVWAGVLLDATPGQIRLGDARMLRYRWANEGTGLSGVAETGMNLNKIEEIKINKPLKEVMITENYDGVSTFFLTSEFVEKQIREWRIG